MKTKIPRESAISPDLWVLLRRQAALFKALATERRLAIVWLLSRGEMCVGDLAEALDTSVPNISQHLRVMRESGFVKARREGQTVLCSLTNPKIFEGCCVLREALVDHQHRERSAIEAAERHFRSGRHTRGGERP